MFSLSALVKIYAASVCVKLPALFTFLIHGWKLQPLFPSQTTRRYLFVSLNHESVAKESVNLIKFCSLQSPEYTADVVTDTLQCVLRFTE